MKTKNMTTLPLRNSIPSFLIPLALAVFALSPIVQAQLSPPPDGGYPNGNTAEGDNALFSLTIGSNNTAIGSQALFYNEDGNDNTAIGYQALGSNSGRGGGFDNTAIGSQALFSNHEGLCNTAIGSQALFPTETATTRQ
jgi:hypothetical protein